MSRLRVCPVCGSRAISNLYSDDFGDGTGRLSLRCGRCYTWRGRALASHRARVLERRLERILKRDRRAITDEVRRIERAGIDSNDLHPARTTRLASF